MTISQEVFLNQSCWRIPAIVHAVQNDSGRELKMIIQDETITSGATATLSVWRADDTHYDITDVTLSTADNSFTANITQALTCPGETRCQLKISGIVSTYTFIIDVQHDTSGVASPQEGISLTEAVEAAEDAADRAEEAAETFEVDDTLSIPGKAADAKAVGDAVEIINSEINTIKDKFKEENIIDFSLYTTISRYISPSADMWFATNQPLAYMIEVPNDATEINIIANAENDSIIALLKTDDTTLSTTPNYADGQSRITITANTTLELSIPSDCNYLFVQKQSGSSHTDRLPQSASFILSKNIPDIDSTLSVSGDAADAKVVGDKLKTLIPFSDYYALADGYAIKYADGDMFPSTNFSATDYIDIHECSRIAYKRIKSVGANPTNGMAFYDTDKEYISGIQSIANAASSSYEYSIVDVPEGVYYARFSWWAEAVKEDRGGDFLVCDAEQFEETLSVRVEKIERSPGTPSALVHMLPQNEGVQNAILTARQFTDIEWIPVADMPGIYKDQATGEYLYRTFKKGCRQRGIPYASGNAYVQRVNDSISFDTFATAAKSEGSVLYTKDLWSPNTPKKATYYGISCSKMVLACWGAPQLADSQRIFDTPGIVKIADPGEFDETDIQLGDGILNPNVHCTIVTDILLDAYDGSVKAIEISEATSRINGTCRRLVWSLPEFWQYFGDYGLYRYPDIVHAKYRKAKYIDIDDGYEGVNDIPIAIRRGSFINESTGNDYKADVDNTKWTTLHDIVDGVEQTTAITTSEITLPKDRTGYHEVYPTDAGGNKGNSSFYFVYEASVSGTVSDGAVTITYSITEGAKPWLVLFDAYHYEFVDETAGSAGTISDVEIPDGMTECRIYFRSEYGVIVSNKIDL